MLELLLKFCFGVVFLLLSTQAFVKLAKKISLAFRISPLIVGITIVALGTSLPELSVSLIASIRKDAGLAFGNIIGSNIYNLLLIGGLVTIFSPIIAIPVGDWVWLMATAICFVFILRHYSGKVVPKRVGVFLLVLSLIYLLTLTLSA